MIQHNRSDGFGEEVENKIITIFFFLMEVPSSEQIHN